MAKKDFFTFTPVHNAHKFNVDLLKGEVCDFCYLIDAAEEYLPNPLIVEIAEEALKILAGHFVEVGEVLKVVVGQPCLLKETLGGEVVSVPLRRDGGDGDIPLCCEVSDVGVDETECETEALTEGPLGDPVIP